MYLAKNISEGIHWGSSFSVGQLSDQHTEQVANNELLEYLCIRSDKYIYTEQVPRTYVCMYIGLYLQVPTLGYLCHITKHQLAEHVNHSLSVVPWKQESNDHAYEIQCCVPCL